MARSTAQIKSQMIAQKNAEAALAGLTSTSTTAMWNLYIFLMASAIAIFEQILDVFKSENEAVAAAAKVGAPRFIRKKVLEFQYDGTTPQVAQFNPDYTVTYPIITEQFKILTRCSVSTTISRKYLVKVAKSEPPVPISGSEKTALTDYIGLFNGAGLAYEVVSTDSDKIEVVGSIYYDGQYNAVIAGLVKAAINTYLANIDFDGTLSIQALTDAIKAVNGVFDVRLETVRVRQNATPYVDGIEIYSLANAINTVTYNTFAGYIEEETESGHTFADTLTFVAQ